MKKIPATLVHYGRHDPRVKTGGVETFARNLGLVFEGVRFLTPDSAKAAMREVMDARLPVVCDNQLVVDWPTDYPVVGFQHGVAAEKAPLTGSRTDRRLARDQAKAARRPNTLWVACAQWISRAFESLHGNGARHIIYHFVDLQRFDGRLDNEGSRLLLHDGRSEHKGKALFEHLTRALPRWSFESLDCKPAEVPDRMRSARAFLHLSRYEGNSIVCNEAMAMDLPCLFTRVGLMRDGDDFDVHVIDPEAAFGDREHLVSEVEAFIEDLPARDRHPRRWSMQHATPKAAISSWTRVVADLAEMGGWSAPAGA